MQTTNIADIAKSISDTVISSGGTLFSENFMVKTEFPASPVADETNDNLDFVGTTGTPVDPMLGPFRTMKASPSR
jgi:hypothetical protein